MITVTIDGVILINDVVEFETPITVKLPALPRCSKDTLWLPENIVKPVINEVGGEHSEAGIALWYTLFLHPLYIAEAQYTANSTEVRVLVISADKEVFNSTRIGNSAGQNSWDELTKY